MIRSALAVLAVPLLLAAPALAQEGCPVAADLAQGIRIDYDDGSTELFRTSGDPGIVAVLGTFEDGAGYRLELGRGVHLISFAPTLPDGSPDVAGRVAYDYGRAVEELPVPAPGGRFDTPVTATDSYGPRDEAQSQAYGEAEVLRIGGCSYDAVPVLIAYDTPNDYVEALHYLPGLGFGFLRWQEETGQPRREIAPVAIRAGK